MNALRTLFLYTGAAMWIVVALVVLLLLASFVWFEWGLLMERIRKRKNVSNTNLQTDEQ